VLIKFYGKALKNATSAGEYIDVFSGDILECYSFCVTHFPKEALARGKYHWPRGKALKEGGSLLYSTAFYPHVKVIGFSSYG
jgi:hypothetical protein